MADLDAEEQPVRTSFVNENFDDLESASSKDSLPQRHEGPNGEAAIANGDNNIITEGAVAKDSMELSSEVPTLEVTPTPDGGYNPFAQSSPSPPITRSALSASPDSKRSSSPIYDQIITKDSSDALGDNSGGNLLRPSSEKLLHDLQVSFGCGFIVLGV